MKITRTYTIDAENVEKLKNFNASDLINNLLSEHFKKIEIKGMNKEQLKKFVARKKLEQEYKIKMAEIENGFK